MRFNESKIYTKAGIITIAVNPFHRIEVDGDSIYSETVMKMHAHFFKQVKKLQESSQVIFFQKQRKNEIKFFDCLPIKTRNISNCI